MTAPVDSEQLARLGYQAYGKTTDFKNYQGLPMPEWDQLPPRIREAWHAAALAIASAVVDEVVAATLT